MIRRFWWPYLLLLDLIISEYLELPFELGPSNPIVIEDTYYFEIYNLSIVNSTAWNTTLYNYTSIIEDEPSNSPSNSPSLSLSDLSSSPTIMNSNRKLWIYSKLYSQHDCSSSCEDLAFGVSTDSCIVQSPFLTIFSAFFEALNMRADFKAFKIEGAGKNKYL